MEFSRKLEQPAAEVPETIQNGAGGPPSSTYVATLEKRDREQRNFLENAAVAMHWVGEDGTILWANRAELELLGYTAEDYIGRNIAAFHMDEPVIRDILKRLKGNEELRGYEARLRCQDGTVRYVSINSSVYREEGRFVHTRCIMFDIGAQRRNAELDERLAAIVESSDDAIYSEDSDGIVRSWNRGAQQMFGYSADEIIGKSINILAPPGREPETTGILDELRRGGRVQNYETKRRAKDGRVFELSLTASPLLDANGTVIGASSVARDITERERQAQALRDANAALTRSNADLQQFVHSASHDLQEPLRMVSAYSELLKREFGSRLGATGDEYIGYTIEGALRMEQLLKDLRAYTLASTSGLEPAGDVDSGESLDKALANLAVAIKESGASITRSDLPCVRMHDFQLEQLFQNLVGNAIRYRSGEPPRIHIAAERQGKDWLFSVRDNGIGIASAIQGANF